MGHFKPYNSIENIKKLWMTVTQKIHGTNAQVLIEPANTPAEWVPAECGYQDVHVYAGSRTRWLTPDDDNYGFAAWVRENQQELARKLGIGRHYGEWCGKGINNGEGLDHKEFVLFDWWNYPDGLTETYIMPNVRTVPVLYRGQYSDAKIDEIMADLKATGSKLLEPGKFMKPEGIVIDINGTKYKKVFEQEETAWKRSDKPKLERIDVDVAHLLQPIRLEKIISRDERYTRNYPNSLRDIVAAYAADLKQDDQYDEEDVNLRKSLSKALFPFVRHIMESK